MLRKRYHANSLECFWDTAGINRQPAFTRGRIHQVREDHEVQFRITDRDEDYNLETEIVSGWD